MYFYLRIVEWLVWKLFLVFVFVWMRFLNSEDQKRLQRIVRSSTIRKAIGQWSETEVLKDEK